MIVFDITDRQSFVNRSTWKDKIKKNAQTNAITMLIGTCGEKSQERTVSTKEAKVIANLPN